MVEGIRIGCEDLCCSVDIEEKQQYKEGLTGVGNFMHLDDLILSFRISSYSCLGHRHSHRQCITNLTQQLRGDRHNLGIEHRCAW
jgi:hypothetical protein